MSKFSNYEYRKQPGFDMNTFEGANAAIPMKTLMIYCFTPRGRNPAGDRQIFWGRGLSGGKHSRRIWQSGWPHTDAIYRD